MRAVDLIFKKRSGSSLTEEEIRYLVQGYVEDSIPDYQMAAFLMALWFRGMNREETKTLTLAMTDSGDRINLSAIPGIKVDKHSTGGVADTTTLVVGPLVAACGGKVAKMSGRGLGHTGGTIDKLESIPGFSTSLPMERFVKIVSDSGLSVIGQTANLVPADKKIYALRDVTATVDSIPLIAASIMSKKIAAGADAIVLDVKTGSGAFMQKREDAEELARVMVDIGTLAKRETIALVTDMNQPLGNAIGNALEVREALEILQGKHQKGDLLAVSFALAEKMLILGGLAETEEEAREKLAEALEKGRALESFRKMIIAQGGESEVCDNPEKLPKAAKIIPVKAERAGFIFSMKNDSLGNASQMLGAGRQKKGDVIDPAVGIWIKKRIGDRVEKGEELALFHVNKETNLEESIKLFTSAVIIMDQKPDLPPLIYSTIES